MKRKNKLMILLCFTLAVIFVLCVSIFSISAVETSKSQDSCEVVDECATEFDKLNYRLEELEHQKDENDILALNILRRYGKTDITELSDDREVNFQLMDMICEIINNDITEDEETVLKKFLDRRYFVLLDNSLPCLEGQDELQTKVENILNFDHWEN